jgi:hypothetical protein
VPGKSGVNISKKKYDLVKNAIVESVRAKEEIAFKELTADVKQLCYLVRDDDKLDLEARGVIERVPGSRPQRLRLGEQRANRE